MALFVVNRYVGENGENELSKKSDANLQKLLEKIEERQKLKLQKSKKLNNVDYDSDDTADERNKIKASEAAEEDFESKEKKKKKRKSIHSELDNSVNEKEKKTKKLKLDCGDDSNLNGSLLDLDSNKEDLKNESAIYDHESSEIVTKLKKVKKKKRKISETEVSTTDVKEDGGDLNKEAKIKKKRKIVSSENEAKTDEAASDDNNRVESVPVEVKEGSSIKDDNTDQLSEFTVIGGHNFKHKKPVKWVLPEWLSKPIIISGSLKDHSARIKHFSCLDESIIKNLRRNKIKYFFPVQQQVIPWVLSETRCSCPGLGFWPRDICVSAPTGSGKTLSFVLPIIQRLKKRLVRRIGALVVVPVQDLAAQVAEVFGQYTFGTGLKVLSVTGKKMPLEKEQKLLVYQKVGGSYESLVDIMVTTPGRLVEHIKETPGFSLHHLKFLIIDEADRVIDNFKNDWLYHLENHISSGGIGAVPPISLNTLKQLPPRPQKLLFSATLTQDPEKLKQINLFQPRLFIYKASDSLENGIQQSMQTESDLQTNQVMKPVELEEQWIECSTQLKPLILYHILAEKKWRGVLCFTHFSDATHRLTRLLCHLSTCHGLNLTIEEISSERSFNDRHRILNDFRAGKIDVLVCTDLYARGMDILEVRYVVLYSPPVHSRNYIHQVGRTARAGMKGTALTLLTPPQVKSFHKMLKSTGHSDLIEVKITEKDLTYLEKPYKKALRSLKKETVNEKESTKEQVKKSKRRNFVHHNRNFVRKSINNFKKKKLKQNLKGSSKKSKNKNVMSQ